MTYENAVARLRGVGTTVETDWPRAACQPPYRLAHLTLEFHPEEAIARARDLFDLAIVIGGNLTLTEFRGVATVGVYVRRPLTPEEIEAALPRAASGAVPVLA